MPSIPDANTGLEALAAAQAAKTFLGPLAERVLGPTADYLGVGLADWSQRRRENVGRIFKRADERLTDGERAKGSVPPRVLKAVLEDGSFCDDELAASYFGGVLASSKTDVSRDDRGATLTALVGRLSSYEIRTHYLLYAHAQARLAGSDFNFGLDTDRQQHARVFLPMHVWMHGMEFSHAEAPIVVELMHDTLQGLLRESLIEVPFGFGAGDPVRNVGFPTGEVGLATQLSPLGVQLFVWAHGQSRQAAFKFLDPNADFSMPDMPILEAGALVLADVRTQAAEAQLDEAQPSI